LLFFAQFVREGGKKTRNISFFERVLEMLREGRKEGKKDMKDSEEARSQTKRLCSHNSHNLDLETTTQTFMLQARPIPLCPWHP
jgi:hypothetical protein